MLSGSKGAFSAFQYPQLGVDGACDGARSACSEIPMPGQDSSSNSTRLGRRMAEKTGIEHVVQDIAADARGDRLLLNARCRHQGGWQRRVGRTRSSSQALGTHTGKAAGLSQARERWQVYDVAREVQAVC